VNRKKQCGRGDPKEAVMKKMRESRSRERKDSQPPFKEKKAA